MTVPHEAPVTPPPPHGHNQNEEARRWAMITHLSALIGLLGNGIGFLLAPLIVWLIKKDLDPFVDDQGKEAVNFQITMFIAAIIALILSFVLIGIPILIVIGLMAVIFPIVAAIKASEGNYYRYPLTIRFLK
ncbi:MAG: DUF4870 domain-containing protein [Acidobacteria bacterium]|nr:DUF4870 domain-containing protein [Acidobacteriota bacterium]